MNDYRPKSIFKIPATQIRKAKYPVIDVHSHAYAKTPEQIAEWVKIMDAVGIEKSVVFDQRQRPAFDEIYAKYAKHPGRFDDVVRVRPERPRSAGFGPAAVKELERCYRAGARGVGEVIDKGAAAWRQGSSRPAPGRRAHGPAL